MTYHLLAFLSVLIFACIHLLAEKFKEMGWTIHGSLISIGGGISIAYVFIDLLPKLSSSNVLVSQTLSGVIPYFERHVYIMALCGFLLFFFVDRIEKDQNHKKAFWLSLSSSALFNFLIGYAVTDQNNPEVRPLFLFTLALAMYYLANDYSLTKVHRKIYKKQGRWILILSLFLGWLIGLWIDFPPTAVALASAFIGGGVIMNVIRHELPGDRSNSLAGFLLAAIVYMAILLLVGT